MYCRTDHKLLISGNKATYTLYSVLLFRRSHDNAHYRQQQHWH